MTRFTDGPAAGKALHLRGSPKLLRVCVDRKGNWDALDQPTDMPAAGETMHVYRLDRIEKLNAICCTRGKGGSHSFSSIAHYRLNEAQPSQQVMQSPMDFAAWCREQNTEASS